MAWNMDANYGKNVNSLLNKTMPPMDENGNYIINAGSRSEYRVPKAEFEAQQKNAPTQTDMGALTKMLSEREANRLKAAEEAKQNNPYFQENAMGSQRNQPISGAINGQNYYGPDSVKGAAGQPYVTSNANAPLPDQSGPTGTAKVAAPPQPVNPNAPTPDVDTPKAIGPKSNTNIYSKGQVVTSNGKRYVSLGNEDFVSEDEIKANPQKYPNFAKTLGIGTQTNTTTGQTPTATSGTTSQGGKIFTGNTIDPSKDPGNLPYNNPESNKPISPTSYSGQISLPTPPEEMQLMDFLKKQFEDKTWENKYGDLQKQYQALVDRPDKYSGMIEKAGGEDVAGYIKSLYEGSADPLRREAQRMQDENAANLAARGLGMSTVVNDVNSGVQRELMANLGDLSNKANVQGRDMYLNALKSAADVYGQHGAQQGNFLNAMQTNIGNQMGAQQIGLANINDILAKQEARRLTNMQTGINQWDKDVANYWKYMYYPIDAYAGQNSTANTAAQVGTNQYNQATSNAATQNQTAGNVGSMLAQNMFKQPQNTSWQPISQQQAQTSLVNATNAVKKIPFGGQIS